MSWGTFSEGDTLHYDNGLVRHSRPCEGSVTVGYAWLKPFSSSSYIYWMEHGTKVWNEWFPSIWMHTWAPILYKTAAAPPTHNYRNNKSFPGGSGWGRQLPVSHSAYFRLEITLLFIHVHVISLSLEAVQYYYYTETLAPNGYHMNSYVFSIKTPDSYALRLVAIVFKSLWHLTARKSLTPRPHRKTFLTPWPCHKTVRNPVTILWPRLQPNVLRILEWSPLEEQPFLHIRWFLILCDYVINNF